jgi:hypothetical protein
LHARNVEGKQTCEADFITFQVKPSKLVNWKKWQGVTMKGKNGAVLKKQGLVPKEGSAEELIIDLMDQLTPWAYHTFVAKWQYDQFRLLKENLPANTLLTVVDFSENYRCSYQDEISAAYYMYSQVTLHPVQCYYHSSDDTDEIVQEAVVYLSDDLVHDHTAVSVFNEHLYKHLEETRQITIEKHVQFSDGCAAQYKGKNTFADIEKMTLPTERCFFGSRHGKGPCDALGGLVKNCASRHVKSRKGVIANAEDMLTFANENLARDEKTNKRVFFLISAEEIQEQRNKVKPKTKTVPDTREIHAITNSPDGLRKRFLACYCSPCRSENYDGCENKDYVDPWQPASKKRTLEKNWKLPIKKKKDDGSGKVSKAEIEEKEMPSKKRKRETEEAELQSANKKKYATEEQREERAKLRRSIRLFAARKRHVPGEPQERKVEEVSSKKERKWSVPERATPEEGRTNLRQRALFSTNRLVNRRLRMPCKERSTGLHVLSENDMSESQLMDEKDSRTDVPSQHVKPKASTRNSSTESQSKNNSRDKRAEREKTHGIQIASNNSSGDTSVMTESDARKLLRALVHSPYHIQVSTASGIQFKDVQVQKELSILKLKASVDDLAHHLKPDDIPPDICTEPAFPIIVGADGNCLPRVASVLLYGDEKHHLEARLRIAVEMIMFKEVYLSEEHLSKGLSGNQCLTPAMVAQFSDCYTMQHLDTSSVEAIYLKEVQQVLKPQAYMGLWQLFALASVLKNDIFSAYPRRGNRSVRKDFHRLILPREAAPTCEIGRAHV